MSRPSTAASGLFGAITRGSGCVAVHVGIGAPYHGIANLGGWNTGPSSRAGRALGGTVSAVSGGHFVGSWGTLSTML